MCPYCQGNHEWSACPVVFKPIADCEFADPKDGCCSHPKNMTPECHVGACPRLDDRVEHVFRRQFKTDEKPVDPIDDYTPAQITEADRVLATHCETFLCTECAMTRADRMARITQSIADFREFHVRKARR